MAKELPYFKFEPSEWDNGNIQMCSRESKGLFIDLCSIYWSRLGELPYALALQKHCNGNKAALQELIDHEIFGVIEGQIVIEFLDEQLAEFNQTSEKRRNAANKRWKDASALQVQSKSNAIRGEKKREEKRIVLANEDFFESNAKAFEEISTNYQETEPARNTVRNNGWAAVTDNDINALLFHFLESQADVKKQDKSDIKSHFKRWLNKQQVETLQKLSISIHARRQRQAI